MEAAGLAVGVAGLAGLFSACVDCFELIQRGRYLGKEYLLLETRYSNQRLRLITWGKACGLLEDGASGEMLHDQNLKSHISDTLLHIISLLNDGNGLKKKYGLKKENARSINMATTALRFLPSTFTTPRSTTLRQGLQDLRDQAVWTRKNTSIAKTTRWVIEDKRKFAELVQNLKDLIDDLESLSRPLDISQRQRSIIQWEMESISDIEVLENIEEARLGRIDAISDAASLRLWTLRDQFLADAHMHISVDQRSQQRDQENEDWEDLSIHNIHSPGASDAHSQVLHRVFCSDTATQIYLDRPSYRPSERDNDQWVCLEDDRPSYTLRSVHPGGNRQIPDLDAYLQQNRQLAFLVFMDYKCDHNCGYQTELELSPFNQAIYLSSPAFCSALGALYKGLCVRHQLTFAPKLTLEAPFLWFYDSRLKFKEELDRMEAASQARLRPFYETLIRITREEFEAADRLIEQKSICWKYVHYLFAPGCAVLDNRKKDLLENGQVYELIELPQTVQHKEGKSPYLVLRVYAWDFQEEFTAIASSITLKRPDHVKTDDESFSVHRLALYPLAFLNELSPDNFRERCPYQPYQLYHGEMVAYSGAAADTPETYEERRFMVDMQTYRRRHGVTYDHTEDIIKTSESSPKDGWLLLSPKIMGFDLRDYRWRELFVSRIKPIVWKPHLFTDLILSERTKDILRAIVPPPDRLETRITQEKPNLNQSSIILFHGGPGRGKTSAVEGLAEISQKAIYRLTMADVGTTAADLEKAFKDTVNLTRTWNCIILVEDADLLVKKRSYENMERNAVVATIIKLIDEFRGTLILTSTRVGVFDEAFRSRFDFRVHFQPPGMQKRVELQKRFLRESLTAQEYDNIMEGGELYKLLERDFRIHEMQKAVSVARRLAMHAGCDMREEDLVTVISQIREFHDY